MQKKYSAKTSMAWKRKTYDMICEYVNVAEKIVVDSKQVRLLQFYKLSKHRNASDAVRNISDTMGPSTVSYDAAKVWFSKFNNGDFDLATNQDLVGGCSG